MEFDLLFDILSCSDATRSVIKKVMTDMKRSLHFLFQLYTWLILAPIFSVLTLIFGAIATTLAITMNPRIASKVGGELWAKLLLWMTPVRVRIDGRHNVNPHQSYVIISNHQSQYDILVLYGYLGMDFRWVMKQELRKIPGLGIGCVAIGHIFIDRSNHEAAVASINAAKKQLTKGTSILFFPEGTRRSEKTLGEFKKGAFRMSIDMGLPILPVTIDGTDRILPPRSWDLYPGTVTMTFHEPLVIPEDREHGIEELISRARQIMHTTLNRG